MPIRMNYPGRKKRRAMSPAEGEVEKSIYNGVIRHAYVASEMLIYRLPPEYKRQRLKRYMHCGKKEIQPMNHIKSDNKGNCCVIIRHKLDASLVHPESDLISLTRSDMNRMRTLE